ncbi:MJ0042 family finger-like protein, partial [Burkholderia sp. H160]
MHLATRCPFCETVFRLQPAQLAQRRGLVRCGHCQEVFDASSSLFDVAEGGDFSTAKPIAAAAAIEALSGVRQPGPDFSGDALDSRAPASGHISPSISSSTLDNRLRENATSVPLAPLPLGADLHTPAAPITPRQPIEPELPAGGFTAPLPADDEPTLADAPLEPFAYPADDTVDEPAVVPPAAHPAAPAAPLPPEDEAPRVWRKVERPAPSTPDEPALHELAGLHGMSDNEPRFGSIGTGPASFGTA